MQPSAIKNVFLAVCASLLLVGSWLFPPTRALWDALDAAAFRAFQGYLVNNPGSHLFWAWMNSRYADWLCEALIMGLLGFHVYSGGKEQLRDRLKQLAFIVVFVAATQILINKGLCVKVLSLKRLSPSLVLGVDVNLAETAQFLNNKAFSHRSFPADHATTLFLSTVCMWRFCVKPVAYTMTGLAILFSMPRLLSGAHWLSDILVGTLAITILAAAVALPASRRLRKVLAS